MLSTMSTLASGSHITANSPDSYSHLSSSELHKAVAKALSNEEVKRLREFLIAEGYIPRIDAAKAVYWTDELGIYYDFIIVSIPFTTPAEDPGKFDFETTSDYKVLIIVMRGEGTRAYVTSKPENTVCEYPRHKDNPVSKTCSGFSYCDRLYEDDYPGQGKYCKNEGSCEGKYNNHYHEGWWIYDPETGNPIYEMHTSFCEDEGGPCGQSDCHQHVGDYWWAHMAPGCWDSNDYITSFWSGETATDCCYKISSCAC